LRPRHVAGIALVFLLVISLPVYIPAYAYSSNSNYYMGITPNECSNTGSETNLEFTSNMITTGVNGNQWSAQANSYAVPNVRIIDFMQFNMAIDKSGHVYAAVEYWTTSGELFNWNSAPLATVSHVYAGDAFWIITYLNVYTQVVQAEFDYYRAATQTLYSVTYNIPGYAWVPLVSWQLNIVGENNLNNPYATFVTGSGQIAYTSSTLTGQMTGSGMASSCAQQPIVWTAEQSNMAYGSLSPIPSWTVTQNFW